MPQLSYRAVLIERASINANTQEVDASLSSEAAVERFPGEVEVLSHDPGAIDLSRAADGLPLLFAHDQREPIGIIENVRIEAKRLVGRLRFGASQRAKEIFADVQAGVLKNLSVGYLIHSTQPIEGGVRVTRWSIFEASIVGVPLDTTVGIGRSAHSSGEHSMETEVIETQTPGTLTTRARIDKQIRELVQIAGTDPEWAALSDALVTRGASVEDARATVFQRMADKANANPTRSGPIDMGSYHAIGGYDSPATETRAMSEALASRFGVAPTSDQARDFTSLRVVDMARRSLEIAGVRTTGMSPSTLIGRALHGTSDFPLILADTAQRVLRQSYAAYQGGIRRICKESTARDFRSKTIASLGEMPELKKVAQNGEFTHGSMAESAESYRIDTYGRIFGISRQALVNDDLGAFGDLANRYGRAAAEFEAQFLIALLTSNPTLADNVALFHANHGNLAGVGSAIGVTSLGAARQAMRLQKGLDGKTPVDVTPRYLVVPAAQETVADQYVAAIQASQASNTNPFAGKLEVVVDPRLDTVSGTAWYLAADSNLFDTIEYSYLETEQGPIIETRNGFEVDGLEVKVRLDFGAGLLDHRGLYRNPGT